MKFQEIINQNKPVLIDFFAEWCEPCKVQAPILHEIKRKLGDKASIIKIDVDKNHDLASKFQIRSVPTLMVFKSGELKWKQSGVFQCADLEHIIYQHLGE